MTPLQNLTVEQLRKLIAIKEQIETLRGEIESIASGGSSTVLEKATADDESPARGQGRGVYKKVRRNESAYGCGTKSTMGRREGRHG